MTYTAFKRKIIKILKAYGYCITSTWANEDILEALVNLLKEKEHDSKKEALVENPSDD